jgi:hypothetical protein
MQEPDKALSISNPRLLAAIYFTLLTVLFTLSIDALLYAYGINEYIPLYQMTLLGVIIAACSGALFGELIVHSQGHYLRKAFFWGFLMTMVALLFYDIGFLCLLNLNIPTSFAMSSAMTSIHLYFLVLFYSFILVGWWLGIIFGLTAMYLRGSLVYYLLRSLDQ